MPERSKMGLLHVEVAFHGRNGLEEHRRLLVDTGSLYTWIPASLAERLGIERKERMPFLMANGDIVERWIGEVEVEILGRRATRIIVFGDEGTPGMVGADTLEGLALEVDPVRLELRRASAATPACRSHPEPQLATAFSPG